MMVLAEAVLLIGLSVGLWIARFAGLSLASFIHDEPTIQLMIDQHFHARSLIGKFPLTGMSNGRGVLYGPAPLWVYSVARFFSYRVEVLVAYEVTLWLLGVALFYRAIREVEGRTTANWFLLLVSASPYLFFYSRQVWDVTLFFPITGAIVFFLVRSEKRRESSKSHKFVDSVVLGFLCGLTIDTHLMGLPIAAAAAILFFGFCLRAWREGGRQRAAAFLASLSLTCFPYFSVVWRDLLATHQFHPKLSELFHFLPRCWLWSGHVLSFGGMDYFLRLPGPVFQTLVSREISAPFLVVAGIFATVSAFRWFRGKADVSVIAKFEILCWMLFMIYYFGIRPEIDNPQYFLPVATAAPFFLACVLGRSWKARSSWISRFSRLVLRSAVWALVSMNVIWLSNAVLFVWNRHGAREDHYGPAVAELERTSARLCDDPSLAHRAIRLDFGDVQGVTPYSFMYLTSHRPGCDIKISPEATEVVRISYESTLGADASLAIALKRASIPHP